ncbi:putative elongation factor 1-beta/1-delta 2 [Caenorhabditis elegans]|uniref:Probable elongation factor 1-beta/1-delta 2 n=1 Tax=Caenorhabditis elegans TaxID=6239 RepID=EF1B2_CAEEL|nr:putative elongation factor 1-beta/1-delta 2 [Caenorhabditis elegans]Q9U2H9.4 RecName: Full=Probable elongation factor 1-beta/1-delta 2; Short=EF-1-beta/delta 2 [Caenorhabditis elegans]CAB63360.2 Probable elongation factor 1-beta/1-delta 2 [Caenorhabditis elegans]|eukprot:NP_502816.2 Probable elongation factor 1-beta/1-delta 2 [Caenorhabditis elegans]
MSVEGLLSEVKHFNAHHLDAALGEQLFYGGKRVFSDVKPGTSSGGDHGCKGGKSELKGAIHNAKHAADKALNKEGGEDVSKLREEHSALAKKVDDLASLVAELQLQLSTLRQGQTSSVAAPAAAPAAAKEEAAGDDDFDLFGSEDEEEDEEKKKVVEERLAAYAAKKATKAGPIAKSSVILDVKPWDDETDLGEMEKLVRSIEMDGLVWGGAKLIPIGYGIKKLQIITVIEDLKVSVDDLIEKITGDFEDHVQSVDIVAFNKI